MGLRKNVKIYESQSLQFLNFHVLAQAHIPDPIPWAPQTVAQLSAVSAWRGHGERCLVEPDRGAGERRARDRCVARQSPELVAAAGADAGDIGTGANRERNAGLCLIDARYLPTAERGLYEPVVAVLEERQVVNVVGHQHVGAV